MCGNVFQSHTCEIPPHLLAISSGHNTQQRERKAPNALIHWTAALLLLQRRKMARCGVSAQRALPYLCLFPPLVSISFVFPAVIQSLSLLLLFLGVLHFLSGAAFLPSQVAPSSSISSFQLLNSHFNCTPRLLHIPPRFLSSSHLSLSGRLPSPFPRRSPRRGRPPVSSLGGHDEKLARGSDNPLTPHLSSAMGKAPS